MRNVRDVKLHLKKISLYVIFLLILHHIFKSVAAFPKPCNSHLKMLHSKYIPFLVHVCKFSFLWDHLSFKLLPKSTIRKNVPWCKISAFEKIRLIEKSNKKNKCQESYFTLFFLANGLLFPKSKSGILKCRGSDFFWTPWWMLKGFLARSRLPRSLIVSRLVHSEFVVRNGSMFGWRSRISDLICACK